MNVDLKQYVLPEFRETPTYAQVSEIADRLYKYLNKPHVLKAISKANQPGNSSSKIQEVFLEFANTLGFESEKKGLFKDTGLALRPDYFCKVKDTGILLEVERGKTTINNMDILDFWKCHLCLEANHLFLLVPKSLRQNPNMKPKNEFTTVARRLSQFFEIDKKTNVHSLFLFGY